MGELLIKQVNVGLSEATHDLLVACATKHNTRATDICRGLVDEAMAFYKEHGFFSFPVRIEPLCFQREYIAAEAPGHYLTISKHMLAAKAAERVADQAMAALPRSKTKRPRRGA